MAQTFALSQTRVQGQSLVVRPRTAAKATRALLVRAQQSGQAGGDLTTPSPDTPQSTLDYAKTMPGVTPPFQDVFDPLNFTENISVQELRRWRESEITHGRVAMLATLGFLVQEQVENTGVGPFPHVTGPAIVHFQQVEAQGAIFWEPLVFAIGLAEAYRAQVGWQFPTSSGFNKLRDEYEPGNLGFDPLGLLPTDPSAKKDMQSREINNGRLAMIAVAGFVAQELNSGEEVLNIITKEAQVLP